MANNKQNPMLILENKDTFFIGSISAHKYKIITTTEFMEFVLNPSLQPHPKKLTSNIFIG